MGKSYTCVSWKNRIRTILGPVYDHQNNLVLFVRHLKRFVWKSKSKKNYSRFFTDEELR